MHLAAKQGNTECIKFLLDFDGDLYSVDFRGWNILHYAAFHGNKDTVYFLCMYDADYDKLKNTRNSQNKLPIEIVRDPSVKPYFMTIFQAAKEGNLDVTKNLINKDDRNLNKQTTFIRNTPLHLAVLNDHYLEVKLLISKGCNISLPNKDNILPYEYAALMYDNIKKLYEEFEDKERGTIDLRNVIRDVIKKKEEILDATICESNRKIRIWTIQDFVEKIYFLLKGKKPDGNGDGFEVPEEDSKKSEKEEKNKEDDNEINKYDGEF
jgi:ankyrin repeat protein